MQTDCIPVMDDGAMEPYKCILICWIGFGAYWYISALAVRPVAERYPWLGQLGHKVPVIIGALLIFWPRQRFPWDMRLPWSGPASAWVGAALCAIGLGGAIWSRRTLAGNWSGNITFKQGHELIERGPYRFVRHPIYTSILLMGLGTALDVGYAGAMAGVALMFLGYWIKLRQEEQLLTRHFPSEYPAYKTRVKALIPFIV